MTPEALAEEAARIGWFHSIPLGNGLRTAGHKTPEHLDSEIALWRFPDDLTGKTFLDIGCADGFWSQLAVTRHASRVLAIDEQVTVGMRFMLDRGVYPFEFRHMSIFAPQFLDLPPFDVVMFAGVIYHTQNPLEALTRLRRVTREVAIVESHLNESLGTDEPYMVFYENDELAGGFDNWWGPNLACLLAMLRTAGFTRMETTGFHHTPPGIPGRWPKVNGRVSLLVYP